MNKVLICLEPGASVPVYANPGDRGADVVLSKELRIKWAGSEPVVCYPTGIRMYDPQQRSIFLYPRSSLTTNTNLILGNSVGVVDGGYIGELEFRFRLSGFVMPNTDEKIEYSIDGSKLQLSYFRSVDPYFSNPYYTNVTTTAEARISVCTAVKSFVIYTVEDKIGQIVIGDGSQVEFQVVTPEEFDTIITQREDKGFGSTDIVNK